MFSQEELYFVVIKTLNNVYCAKSHLVERFSELIENENFCDLKIKLQETQTKFTEQLFQLDEIFLTLKEIFDFKNYDILSSIPEDIITVIQSVSKDKISRDVGLWIYLNYIKTLENLSLHIFNLIDKSWQNPKFSKILTRYNSVIKCDNPLLLLLVKRCINYGIRIN